MFDWFAQILYNFFAVMGFICTAIAIIFLGLYVGTLKREQPQAQEAYLPCLDDEDTQPRHDAVARRLLQDVSLDL